MPAASGSAGELREQLLGFVTDESSKVRQGERLPGTTEVLESCFGKLKALEDGQSKSGFTGLVLSLGAMVSKWTAESIGEALERCRVRDVLDWCRKNLGASVQSQRQTGICHAAMRNKSGINGSCMWVAVEKCTTLGDHPVPALARAFSLAQTPFTLC